MPAVRVVPMTEVEPIALPGGSWSRMVVTRTTAPETTSSLGYSVFKPGAVTPLVKHTVEELAFVVRGGTPP